MWRRCWLLDIYALDEILCGLSQKILVPGTISHTPLNVGNIGETASPFRNRIYEHVASVKNTKYSITPVSKHFHLEDHFHKHRRFSVIPWLGTKINPKTKERHRAKELEFI